jgi:methyl-accepting chemotaxis protein
MTLTIKNKIFILALFGFIGIVLVGYFGIQNSTLSIQTTDSVYKESTVPREKVNRLSKEVDWIFNNVSQVISEFVATEGSRLIMQEKIKEVDALFEQFNENIFQENEAQNLLLKIKNEWNILRNIIHKEIIPAYNDDDIQVVARIGQLSFAKQYYNIKKDIVKLHEIISTNADKIVKEQKEKVHASNTLLYILAVGIGLVFMIIGYFLMRTIIKPIHGLKNGFESIAADSDKNEKLQIETMDEIGEVAVLFNKYVDNIEKGLQKDNAFIEEVKDITNDINYGYFNKTIQKDASNEKLNELKGLLNVMLFNLGSSIGDNLNAINDVLTAYSRYDFAPHIQEPTGRMEQIINQLGDMIRNFQKDIDHIIQCVKIGDFHNQLTLEDSSGELKEIKAGLNSILDNLSTVEEISKILKNIAGGDLSHTIDEAKYLGEYQKLIISINETARALGKIISHADDTTHIMKNGLDEINKESHNISELAENGAMLLKTILTSVDRLEHNISDSAKNAQNTNLLAAEVSNNAKNGGIAVESAESAMIEVANKTKLVEEIAFQTNLLALNAAIEASRAGETGKGFSVVASEVRKLAEHSTAATSDIEDIVKRGISTSKNASRLIKDIIPEINKTANLVDQISNVTNDQSIRTNEIAAAVQNLDSIIEQNAASSTELSATSDNMYETAKNLEDILNYFRLNSK